ncbi:MAG: UDP-N-acetylmuramate--L-alanine ligase [bacterium]|nr:UDP-N-acetylmuramate--L-alanine ligase [bacterium]
MLGKTQQIHFVGIGGIGMSGIAEVLLNLGYRISGSDLEETPITRRLSELGATVVSGHEAQNVGEADVVVFSSAVRPDNVEVVAARERKIPVIRRAEMLAELMRMKYGIAIAGTHGKTTTTSLVASVLTHGGLDPTIVIGGRLNVWETNARLGQGRYLVAEADESDGSFLNLSPTVAVVTTIDEEHLDFYRDLAHLQETFLSFINKIPFYGLAVLCLDEPHIQALIPRIEKRIVTYGLSSQADFLGQDIDRKGLETSYTARYQGSPLGRVRLQMPGVHNVLNSLAAIAVGLELDMDFHDIAEALAEFGGIERRFQIKGERRGVMVVDDYGHHPAEIRATLQAAKDGWGERRLVVVFQPHRYSRTQYLLQDFFSAFNEADVLITTEIYPAGETPIPGVSGRQIYDGVKRHGHRDVSYVEQVSDVLALLEERLRSGDLVLTLGAGDVWKVSDALIARLEEDG